ASLNRVFRELDITQDPDVLHQLAQRTERSKQKLRRIMETHSTYCRAQFKSFCNVAKVMYTQLGPWAANYYVYAVITKFLSSSSSRNNRLLEGLSEEASRYLAEAFHKVD